MAKISNIIEIVTTMSTAMNKVICHKIAFTLISLCFICFAAVLLTASEWLITKRNRKIEVQSYHIKGRMVIMRLQNGQLAQIAYDDIDWEKTSEFNESGESATKIRTAEETGRKLEQVRRPYQRLGEQKKYSGAPISLEFRDAEIRDVLHLFAEFTGLNFVISPEVTGRTTIMLKEVPWDQALETVLRNSGLGMIAEGNIYRIATVQRLIDEEAAQRNLTEQQRLAGPLVTIVCRLSYANASEMARIIEKLLSSRGSVIVDERTNSLIITDIAEVIRRIEARL